MDHGPRRLAYYDRLSAKNKAIYRRSDAISRVELPESSRLRSELRATAAATPSPGSSSGCPTSDRLAA